MDFANSAHIFLVKFEIGKYSLILNESYHFDDCFVKRSDISILFEL